MKVCIDTCAYSRLMLHHTELIACVENADIVCMPSIVIGELITGFILGNREKENRTHLESFLGLPGVEVVSVDMNIADRYAVVVKQLRQRGTPIPTNDIWIAAVALETGARLVSYDTHFNHISGLIVIAP